MLYSRIITKVSTELKASTSSILNQPIDVEYVGSTATINTISVNDSLAKHIPPLTDFEEDYIAMQMIQNCPQRSSIIDAQLYLHRLAITVVQKNYRIKVTNINHAKKNKLLLIFQMISL